MAAREEGAKDGASADAPPLWLFFILNFPYGVSGAFVTVTLTFILAKAGVSAAAIGGMIALSLTPQVYKVLWAAPVDMTWSYRGWLALGGASTGLFLAVTGFAPLTAAGVPLITLLVTAASAASTLTGMGLAGLIAHTVPPDRQGRASGFSGAGNIGGGAIGGGLGLWLAVHAPGGMLTAAVTLGLLSALSALAALVVQEPARTERGQRLIAAAKAVGQDLRALLASRIGLLAAILVILPIATGATANFFPVVAKEWRADADLVALTTGVAGGLASTLGALFAGVVSDRMNRKTAYLLFGLATVACDIAMDLGPRTPLAFAAFTLLYAAANGLMYTGFPAVAYEAVGKGAAATKFQLLNCICNAPIALMTWLQGEAETRYGVRAMLWSEVVATLACSGLFLLIWMGFERFWPRQAAPSAATA